LTFVTTRYVRFQLEQEIWERARRAAKADRRSLANWLAVTVERAAEAAVREPAEKPAEQQEG
jgi:hypothetical protein